MNAYLAPRVKETSTTTGTGTLSLLGAVSGFQTFVSGIGTGNSCYYTIVHGTAWEVGVGTVTDLATDTLSRDTILASSAGGSTLNLGAGTKTVFIDLTRESVAVLGGHLFGCALSNNASDPSNDIDFTAGQCASDDATEANRIILSPAAMTKRLDATWQASTGQGGRLSSDALGASATWHCFAFKPAASPDDYFFSTSVNPTPPSGTKKRRIASLLKGASAWLSFDQQGNTFTLKTRRTDFTVANPGTSAATRTLSYCPTGVNVEAILNIYVAGIATGNTTYFSPLLADDQIPSISVAPFSNTGGTTGVQEFDDLRILVDTSAQIRTRTLASDANTAIRVSTLGWVDRRGRDA